MKLTRRQLQRIIRERVGGGQYASEQKNEQKDQNEDGENDFDDVKIARMKASGMSDKEIREKHPELFENTKPKISRTRLLEIIEEELDRASSLNEARFTFQSPSRMKSRVDPEFAALIKGIVTEVVEEDEDEPNPFGTGNTPVHDPDDNEELVGHT